MGHFITEYYRDARKASSSDYYAEFYVSQVHDNDDIIVIHKILYEPIVKELWKEYWILNYHYDIHNIRIFYPASE